MTDGTGHSFSRVLVRQEGKPLQVHVHIHIHPAQKRAPGTVLYLVLSLLIPPVSVSGLSLETVCTLFACRVSSTRQKGARPQQGPAVLALALA